MSNNNSLAKREPLEVSIADCDRIEDEFARKAVFYSNFFTDNNLKAEAAKQVISRLDHLNRIKLVYDDDKKEEKTEPEIARKPGRIKRAIVTAVTTAALMGAAYLGALTYFDRQSNEAQVQGLTADKRFALMQKQNLERNSLEQQGQIIRLQEDYVNALGQISLIQENYGTSLEEKAELQKEYLTERQKLQAAQTSLTEQLEKKSKEYSRLEQVASELRQGNSELQENNSSLADRIARLGEEQERTNAELSRLKSYDLEIEHFVEAQVIQRTQRYGEYRQKGPFDSFVAGYAEFFYGKPADEQQKQVIDSILRKYVKTDGRNIDEVLKSWNCNTIILKHAEGRLQVIDP